MKPDENEGGGCFLLIMLILLIAIACGQARSFDGLNNKIDALSNKLDARK